MKKQVMLDLETLGKSPGAVIVAIGAVIFDASGLGFEFYQRIDAVDCQQNGLTLDAETVLWWLQQSDEARKEICQPGLPLHEVLTNFANWLEENAGGDFALWGNGASFDNALLAAAYRAAHMETPWKFWNDRCYRTMKAMRPNIKLDRNGTHHNALDDAKSQALHLIQILETTNN